MIAYFDSSSIVKWFFDEPLTELARDIKNKAKIVVTSLLAFPEVLSAINCACREGRCLKSEMELVRTEFLRIWPNFQWLRVNEELMQQAGELIFRHSLRGFDAVHLASALLLKQQGGAIDIFFSCFDHNLNRAARKEGFLTHEI
ncbi:MAG: type II toxin-antitoxin system VapC family toxin [Deltaproteobacteria bacterium]|nr:type II toxin-antitoxin system VapC family toxin [Deltaproteobacteria bacterium]MBW1795983.1 type II toxin-antitoxin system VapC family toxin [Deltaproteobacteria bacterium]MBW2330728.1 type II toxin-antitoxin system VapC family toxin [Deltaproteobacteria bacterium]